MQAKSIENLLIKYEKTKKSSPPQAKFFLKYGTFQKYISCMTMGILRDESLPRMRR